MRLKFIGIFLFLCTHSLTQKMEFSISGNLKSEKGDAINGATDKIFYINDLLLYKLALTDSLGAIKSQA